MKSKNNLTIVGMGYVGLPLALEFSKKFNTIGFDINKNRINNLKKNIDLNSEFSSKNLKKNKNIFYL